VDGTRGSVHDRWARWLYRSGHPNRIAKAMNGTWAKVMGRGWFGPRWITLEVRGRRSGRTIEVPLALVDLGGAHYVVAMLGSRATWVANVRAAGGDAVVVHRGRRPVHLAEVPAELCAPILQRLVQIAPGARPHVPVDRRAPLADFEAIAAEFPAFAVEDRAPAQALAS
jgi:deazaflavin-dependent oxidoreductase (nitroreductase family)